MKELNKLEKLSPQLISEAGKILKDLECYKIALIGTYFLAYTALKTRNIEWNYKDFSFKSTLV